MAGFRSVENRFLDTALTDPQKYTAPSRSRRTPGSPTRAVPERRAKKYDSRARVCPRSPTLIVASCASAEPASNIAYEVRRIQHGAQSASFQVLRTSYEVLN